MHLFSTRFICSCICTLCARLPMRCMCNACPCNPKSTAGGRSKSRDSSDRVRPCGEIAESGDHLRQSPIRSVAIPAIPDFCSLHRPAAVTGLRFGSLRQGPKLQRQRDSDGDSDDNSDGDSDGDSDRNSAAGGRRPAAGGQSLGRRPTSQPGTNAVSQVTNQAIN